MKIALCLFGLSGGSNTERYKHNQSMHSFEYTKESIESYKKYIIDANSDAKIIIEGHADSTGNDQINIPLSELRASQVLDYLIKAGISPERLSIVGYGSSQPIGDNNTDDGRAQNRRVDFTVE